MEGAADHGPGYKGGGQRNGWKGRASEFRRRVAHGRRWRGGPPGRGSARTSLLGVGAGSVSCSRRHRSLGAPDGLNAVTSALEPPNRRSPGHRALKGHALAGRGHCQFWMTLGQGVEGPGRVLGRLYPACSCGLDLPPFPFFTLQTWGLNSCLVAAVSLSVPCWDRAQFSTSIYFLPRQVFSRTEGFSGHNTAGGGAEAG